MNNDEKPFTRELNCWALLRLPLRLDTQQAAKLLGFAEHDIAVLTSLRLLVPLGKPRPNSVKWFSAIELIALASDRAWLDKATAGIGRHWIFKNGSRRSKVVVKDEIELTKP